MIIFYEGAIAWINPCKTRSYKGVNAFEIKAYNSLAFTIKMSETGTNVASRITISNSDFQYILS